VWCKSDLAARCRRKCYDEFPEIGKARDDCVYYCTWPMRPKCLWDDWSLPDSRPPPMFSLE
jgi:hypothetical protein